MHGVLFINAGEYFEKRKRQNNNFKEAATFKFAGLD
jgi:hypothetical protein